MTRKTRPKLLNNALQLLTELPDFVEGIRLLADEAMRLERSQVLQAQPYERTPTRQDHANGFKPETFAARMGAITFAVPQVRGGVEFYPSALGKASAASKPSISPRPKCISKASPPAKSRPSWKNSAAWKSAPPRSANVPPAWIPS